MAGLIPQAFLDELLLQTDIVALIDSYVPLKKRGTSYIACCPFHQEKTPSFNVVAAKQFYHCFGCGVSGNAISFAMQYLNQGFVEAVETLAARLGMSVPKDPKQAEKQEQRHSLYDLLDNVSQYYQSLLKKNPQAVDYLKQRGLSGQTAKRYQLGFAEDQWHALEKVFPRDKAALLQTGMLIENDKGNIYDRYRARIMFPIHNRHGQIIGFGGRSIDAEHKPKYLNSPETILFQKNRELYGLYQIISEQNDIESIIIVEGYMDVIMLAEHGIHYAAATLGTATSEYHIQQLSKYCKQLYFCFDGDEAGKKAAWRALESSLPYLNEGLEIRFVFLPEGHDPDSLVREEGQAAFLLRIQEGKTLQDFFFQSLGTDMDVSLASGKAQLLNQAGPYLKKIPEGLYKQIILDELAKKTHIDNHRLQAMLNDNTITASSTNAANIIRTPLRTAMALLIQNPEIYSQSIHSIHPEQLQKPDYQVLKALFNYLERHPKANTASLVELWRNTDYFDSINKLAAWDHQVPAQEQTKEFIDHVHFLEKKNEEMLIQQLIEKSRRKKITDEERLLLQKMLKKRHEQTIEE